MAEVNCHSVVLRALERVPRCGTSEMRSERLVCMLPLIMLPVRKLENCTPITSYDGIPGAWSLLVVISKWYKMRPAISIEQPGILDDGQRTDSHDNRHCHEQR
jgi:hypothetical protein